MKNKYFLVAAVTLILPLQESIAQNNVGIGTPTPDPSSILELNDNARGLLIPRLTTAERLAVSSPANGLLVFDLTANCFYYFTTASGWLSLCQSASSNPDTITNLAYNPNGTLNLATNYPQNLTTTIGAWLTSGNTGTTPAANYIGTADNNDWVIKTNAIERQRVTNAGAVSVNNNAPAAGNVFSVYGNSTAGALTNTIGATAIAGYAAGTTGIGVLGNCTTGTGVGIQGISNAAYTGASVGGVGVYGLNNANVITAGAQSTGVEGIVTGNLTISGAAEVGVVGFAGGTSIVNSFALGLYGQSVGTPSTGVLGNSNNALAYVSISGSGGAFSSDSIGGYAIATEPNSGNGFVSSGNDLLNYYQMSQGSGITGNGNYFGVAGIAITSVNTIGDSLPASSMGTSVSSGGYFEVDNGNLASAWAYVAALDSAGQQSKILGTGVVSTIVKDLNNKYVSLACPEAPEDFFQDYGKGQLQNGKTHIALDPILSKNITVNEQHDLRVFVQPEGDCKGVYVTNKSATGFDVIELDGGQSNITFSWMITANRADEVLANGVVARYTAARFASAPGPQHKTMGTAKQMPKVQQK